MLATERKTPHGVSTLLNATSSHVPNPGIIEEAPNEQSLQNVLVINVYFQHHLFTAGPWEVSTTNLTICSLFKSEGSKPTFELSLVLQFSYEGRFVPSSHDRLLY